MCTATCIADTVTRGVAKNDHDCCCSVADGFNVVNEPDEPRLTEHGTALMFMLFCDAMPCVIRLDDVKIENLPGAEASGPPRTPQTLRFLPCWCVQRFGVDVRGLQPELRVTMLAKPAGRCSAWTRRLIGTSQPYFAIGALHLMEDNPYAERAHYCAGA
ncbi:uncharacterized protein LOC129752298 [Uranotaenia lowii]|uniref:uncharacterized protein LOC129752298 n=1 Tax=Uranotaenia lowii TaxID=190385 RepID=UPI002479EEE0|nr:uncharacterized protein LOC129752298 [Uranotaenia lowii]